MEAVRNGKRTRLAFSDGQLLGELRSGKRPKEVHLSLGIPLRTIYRKWKRFREEGTITPLPKTGRPKITTAREDRAMIYQVQRNPFLSCKKIGERIGRPDLSVYTIKRRLAKVGGYKSYRAAKKPWLREINRVKRLAWARDHINWTSDQWRSVLWSDESKFEIRNHAMKRVWRKKGKRYDPKNTQGTVKHDKSVMVWGCFSYGGVGRLHRIDGIMKKEQYHAILQRQMLPSARELFGQNPWIFQQDNDPKHTALINRAYLMNQQVNVLDWPAQSPDLNPIEHLWSELDRQLQDRNCNTPDQLFDILKGGWEELEQKYLENLIDSMPRRCAAVIRANGRLTKY
jgi:transposase